MEQAKLWLPKLLAGIVAIVLVLALFNIIKAFLPTPTPEIVTDLNYGLSTELYDDEPGVDITETYSGDLIGSLYFDSIAMLEDSEEALVEGEQAPNLYRYDFQQEATFPIVEYGATYDGNPLSEKEIAFVSALADTANSNRLAHLKLDTTTGAYVELTSKEGVEAYGLAISPENQERVAYVFRTINSTDTPDLSNYELVLVNPYLEKTVVIEDAASPTWLPGKDAVMFVKQDGIYLYDLTTDTSILLTDAYTNLDILNYLAVSPDNSSAILTIPSDNALAVFEPLITEEGDLLGIEETGYISTPGTIYKTPVFSPDGRFYAVIAAVDTGTSIDHTIEIRHSLSRDVIDTVVPTGIDSRFLHLSAWRETIVQGLSEVTEFNDLEL